MQSNIYDELKKNVTASKLKDISISIINGYKNKDLDYLSQLAELIGIEASSLGLNRLFSRLIQVFHPDKHATIIREIETYYKNNRIEELTRLKNIYLVDYAGIDRVIIQYEPDDESRSFSQDDFGYGEFNVRDEEFEDLPGREEFPGGDADIHEYSFMEAVNHLFVGNLDYALTASDLNHLDVELDLSDFDIEDLAGVEHCINLTVLNLSNNNINRIGRLSKLSKLEVLYISDNEIENISALGGLTGLVELDISFNSISDISVLLGLDNLKYVNLINNPIGDKSTINRLLKKGIIVIY